MSAFLLKRWYRKAGWLRLLGPLEWLFAYRVAQRRKNFIQTRTQLWQAPVPIIVVGNISLGGTGKTPLICALTALLKREGYKPGIVSRGYGAQKMQFPALVDASMQARYYGDEPILLADKTQVPVVIDPNRVRAAQYLLTCGCDVILSDDGLQHYAMNRNIEIAVIDGQRMFGNGHLLPVGPLREPINRLASVDWILINGKPAEPLSFPYYTMQVMAKKLICFSSKQILTPSPKSLGAKKIHAVTAIGNPDRFFACLKKLGFEVIEHSYSDHYVFKRRDVVFEDNLPVVMTEKDHVKCLKFTTSRHWVLETDMLLSENFISSLMDQLLTLKSQTVRADPQKNIA